MTAPAKFDPKKTAFLSMDYQTGIVGRIGQEAIAPAAKNAAIVLEKARELGSPIFHIGVGFEEGYPEVQPNGAFDKMLKASGVQNAFVRGHPSAALLPSLYKEGEPILYKKRISGFSGSPLATTLRAQGIENIVMFGIATGGVVLSTLREAHDMDYKVTVVSDACADRDPTVHSVLVEKVFPFTSGTVTASEISSLF